MTVVTTASLLLLLTGAYPLYEAFRAARGTTLRHALVWVTLAAVGWLLALLLGGGAEARYVALCLTACAGVSVLEPRRPGVTAWHFVTFGLLCVLLLPLAQGLGRLHLGPEMALFLSAVLGVGQLNYLPTRLGPVVPVLALGCGEEVWALRQGTEGHGVLAVAAAPWLAWLVLRLWPDRSRSELDRLWRGARDRFGALWAMRLREQFNRAAGNAGWRLHLGWSGAVPADDPLVEGEARDLLEALLKRFRTAGPGDITS